MALECMQHPQEDQASLALLERLVDLPGNVGVTFLKQPFADPSVFQTDV